jgi:hypothetical protein
VEEAWMSTEEAYHLSPWPASLRFEGTVLLRFDIRDAALVGYDPKIFAGEVSRVGDEVF